jgi:hypothetical protein
MLFQLFRLGEKHPFYEHSTFEGIEAMVRFEVAKGRDVIVGLKAPKVRKEKTACEEPPTKP